MNVIPSIADFRQWRHAAATRAPDAPFPFVPTMGALHDGHLSLVKAARELAGPNGKVIASIFVNPTQFAPGEDFAKYPRTLEADLQMLRDAGAAAVFVPTADDMYGHFASEINPGRAQDSLTVDPGPLGDILEGAIRPGHFRGVCTVVLKLLHIVDPTHLFLGQKDFQQQAVLRRMCHDLNLAAQVITCPTLRAPDGLALSSRNRYLNPDQRARATSIFQALSQAAAAFAAGERNPATLEAAARQQLIAHGLEPQYVLAVDPDSLAPWQNQNGRTPVMLVAAKIGSTRLLDNMPFHEIRV